MPDTSFDFSDVYQFVGVEPPEEEQQEVVDDGGLS